MEKRFELIASSEVLSPLRKELRQLLSQAWLREEGIPFNEPAFLPRIAKELACIRGVSDEEFAQAVWRNAMQVLPRWSALCADLTHFKLAS